MRASRLLSILLLLQTRGRMTAQAMAEEFETSIRTIYRDIDQLSAAGVPVYADRGRTGGFQLLEGYRTQLTGLSPQEAETLLLSGLPGPAAELGIGEAMATAQLKMLAALPAEKRSGAARVGSRIHLDPIGWYRSAAQADILPPLATAVWDARRVRVRYESWSGVVDRELEPLGLVLKAGVWYAVAQAGGAPRTYRVSSILSLETLDDTFVRPRDFDLAAYWSSWVRDFEARIYQGEARLRLSSRGLKRLTALSPAAAVEMALRTAGEADGEGWITVTIPIESVDHAVGDVMQLGAEVEVLAPAELRLRIAEVAATLAAMHS